MYCASLPRLKFTAPLLRGGGELHVVGSREVVTIADPDGFLHRLVGLADGSRSTSDLASALAGEYPHAAEADVVEAVARLMSAGLVEDLVAQRRALGARAGAGAPSDR